MRPKSGKEIEREVVKLSKKLVETCSIPNVEKYQNKIWDAFDQLLKKIQIQKHAYFEPLWNSTGQY